MRKKLLILSTIAAGVAFGQAEYFPLHVGNQWVYRTQFAGQTNVHKMEISRQESFGGRPYVLLTGASGGDVWLRMSDDGTLYQYDPDTGGEKVRAAFATPPGGSYETAIDPCSGRAEVVTNEGTYKGPIGEVGGVFEVRYPTGNCADAGLESEQYGRWIGLLRSQSTTIAGPRVADLTYARIGGVTVISTPEVAFGVSLDKAIYYGPEMIVRIFLRNTQPEPVKLVFPSGQRFDIAITDAAGNKVYHWSANRIFPQVQEEIPVSHEMNWVEVIRPTDIEGGTIPPGQYTLEAWLTTQGGIRYLGRIGFEVGKADALPPV